MPKQPKDHVKAHLRKNGVDPADVPDDVIDALNAFSDDELKRVDRLGETVHRLDEAWDRLERGLAISTALGGSVFHDPLRLTRVRVLVRRGVLDEAERELEEVSFRDGTELASLATLRAAQGRDGEAEELWLRALAHFATTDTWLHRAETQVELATFMAQRGRSEAAEKLLAEARVWVEGTGARLNERLIREAEALLP